MGPSSSASSDTRQVRPRVGPAADDVGIRVIGSTILQSIGLLLLMHVGEAGGADTNIRLGLIYGFTHVAIGVAVLGFRPPLKAVVVFLLPGSLLAVLALTGGGYWGGAWLLGLTAWAFMSDGLTVTFGLRRFVTRLLWLILGIALTAPLLGLAIYWSNPGAYLLAFIPGVLLLLDHYARRPWRAATDCLLGVALLTLLITLPEYWLSPEGSFAGISALSGFGITWLSRPRD